MNNRTVIQITDNNMFFFITLIAKLWYRKGKSQCLAQRDSSAVIYELQFANT